MQFTRANEIEVKALLINVELSHADLVDKEAK